ncbi:MAG: hypothetical protein QOE61_2510, partial [Micromonosporaceae bacterium]|nr:hypothetical protein [Micromonosporaceae bacterium]
LLALTNTGRFLAAAGYNGFAVLDIHLRPPWANRPSANPSDTPASRPRVARR